MRGRRKGIQSSWVEDSQVHEDGGNSLAAILWQGVDLIMEEVVVGLVLLAIHVVQDLNALPILHRNVGHLRIAPHLSLAVCQPQDTPILSVEK